MADRNTRERALALQRAMFDAVDEVGRASTAAGIDYDYAKGGVLVAGTSRPELERVRAGYDEMREYGFSEDDFSWLEADAFAERAHILRVGQPSVAQMGARAAALVGRAGCPQDG